MSTTDHEAAPLDPAVLAETPTFRGLDRELLQAILERCSRRFLRTGETLYYASTPYQHEVYIVYRGRLEMRRPGEQPFHVGSGTFIGLPNYLDESPYLSTPTVLEDAEVLVLPDTDLKELERRFPQLDDVVNHFIAERLRSWNPTRQAVSGNLAQPIRNIMKAPLSTCTPEVTLRDAFEIMQTRKIGSLGVVDEDGKLYGLLTCSGMSEAVLLKGFVPHDSIRFAACETPYTIDPDAPLWEAEELQQRHGVKYLVVLEEGAPVGMVSQSDIVRSIHTEQGTLIGEIHAAETIETLVGFKGRLAEVATEAWQHNRLPSKAVRTLNEVQLTLQRRCAELVEQQMEAEGKGAAPLPYAFIIMGSGGRREMLLNADQDNGLILADAEPERLQAADPWFREFCDRVNQGLDGIGYPLCPGDIMARNPMFRKTLSQWREQISYMARHPNQKAARWSNIVFDFNTLVGEDDLTAELRKHVFAELHERPKLLEFMVQDDAEGRPSLGLFNRLVTATDQEHKGTIDVKRNGLRIVADAARIFALHHNVSACNTIDRLNTLMRLGVFTSAFVDTVSAAYEELLERALSHQIEQVRDGETPDKYIDPEQLHPRVRESLRLAMRSVKQIQDRLQDEFTPSPF